MQLLNKINKQTLLEAGCFYTIYSSKYNIKSQEKTNYIGVCHEDCQVSSQPYDSLSC